MGSVRIALDDSKATGTTNLEEWSRSHLNHLTLSESEGRRKFCRIRSMAYPLEQRLTFLTQPVVQRPRLQYLSRMMDLKSRQLPN